MFNYEKLVNRIETGHFCIQLNGERKEISGTGGTGTIDGLDWKINAEKIDSRCVFSLTLTNRTGKTVSIGDISLFTYEEDETHGDLPSRIIYDFRNSMGNNYVVPVTEFGGKFNTCPMFLVTDGKQTALAAQLTYNSNEMRFHSKFDMTGQLERVSCILAAPACPLHPEESITTDSIAVYSCCGTDPLDALFAWAKDVRTTNQPELPEKTWGGFVQGTLIHDPAYTPEQKIIDQVENAGNLALLGLKYVWISISNILGRLPGNWLYPNEENFPHGLHTVIRQIQAAGLVPGFWMNPFAIAAGSRDFERMEPYLIRNQDGIPASRGIWPFAAPDKNGNLPELFALDPAFPEVFEYIKNVLQTYASWGIRYYMIDFLETGRYRTGEKVSGYALENYLRFIRKLREYAAPDTHFLAATGASVIHIGAISSSRIGLDFCEGRPLFKHWPSYPADYVIGGSLGSSGAPHRNAVNNMAMWAFADRNFFRCNSNMMTVDKPIPLNEARMTASLYGISSSPVFFGDHFKFIDRERLELIKKVLPRGDEMPMPVDLFTKTDLEKDFVRVFRLEVKKNWGRYYICAVFNLNPGIREIVLSDRFLRIPKGRKYVAYDFWNEDYLGVFDSKLKIDVRGHTAAVIRLEEKRNHPWLLSTDMTIRQGDAEIDSLEWDPARLCLKGRARRAAGEEGNLFFIAPDGFKVVDWNRGFRVMKSARDMSLIIKRHLTFETDTVDFQIDFERWEGTSQNFRIEQ